MRWTSALVLFVFCAIVPYQAYVLFKGYERWHAARVEETYQSMKLHAEAANNAFKHTPECWDREAMFKHQNIYEFCQELFAATDHRTNRKIRLEALAAVAEEASFDSVDDARAWAWLIGAASIAFGAITALWKSRDGRVSPKKKLF